MDNIQNIKNRFGIIGNDPRLNAALDKAQQIAPTDLSVLITGESGVGKEVIPRIIHAYSPRKHGPYIAINCGAIPEGTIDSELFGHEKGAFTGANDSRKGYFEVANNGTIFLDEVGELPLGTQTRLLRVLETGEFIRVGSSKTQRTNVRVIAATNINFARAIRQGKFREDLYYRLNAIPIFLPPLRERKGDIHQLFRKFALDFAEKYRMPAARLTEDAVQVLTEYRWPGNVRELKNIAEQISILEENRQVNADTLRSYLPKEGPELLPVCQGETNGTDGLSDRDIIFKILFQLREEVNDLKARVYGANVAVSAPNLTPAAGKLLEEHQEEEEIAVEEVEIQPVAAEEVREDLNIQENARQLILHALQKHNGKRKAAAEELGISERTLYRKLASLGLLDEIKNKK